MRRIRTAACNTNFGPNIQHCKYLRVPLNPIMIERISAIKQIPYLVSASGTSISGVCSIYILIIIDFKNINQNQVRAPAGQMMKWRESIRNLLTDNASMCHMYVLEQREYLLNTCLISTEDCQAVRVLGLTEYSTCSSICTQSHVRCFHLGSKGLAACTVVY